MCGRYYFTRVSEDEKLDAINKYMEKNYPGEYKTSLGTGDGSTLGQGTVLCPTLYPPCLPQAIPCSYWALAWLAVLPSLTA